MDQKFMSPEDIRIALGLKPWDEYRLEIIKQILDEPGHPSNKLEAIFSGKRSGRTTRMLTEALFAITQEDYRASIVGYNDDQTEVLIKQAKKYAEQLGLDPERIMYPRVARRMSGLLSVLYYEDHYSGGN